MTQEDLLEACGVVTALLPNLMARVLLDSGQQVDSGQKSSRMSAGPVAHRIGLLVGDRVTDEMTRYDVSKGRISSRHKDEPAPASLRPVPRAARSGRR